VNTPRLVKFIQNYILDSSGVFPYPHKWDIDDVISRFSQSVCLYVKKKITQWLGDRNFIFFFFLKNNILLTRYTHL